MTTTIAPSTRTETLPGVVYVGWQRTKLEVKTLLRSKDTVLFTLGLPVMLLLLFGAIFGDTLEGTTVTAGQWFTPGIIASSVLAAGLVNLATSMAIERHDGTLRRLALTPMPTSAYLIGKILLTLLLATSMTILLLGIGVLFFGVDLPTGADRWITFGWVFLLGVVAAAVLGIALSALPRDVKSASAVFNLPFLFLQFISGVFIEFGSIPSWLQTVAGVFPLRWLASGMRSVFLPEDFEKIIEPGGSYQLTLGAIVLSVWIVAGFAFAIRTFRWGRER
jgi:ABC-2 type transport system permease protein